MFKRQRLFGFIGVFFLIMVLSQQALGQTDGNVEFTNNGSFFGTSLTVNATEVCLKDGTNCPNITFQNITFQNITFRNITPQNLTYGEMFQRNDSGFAIAIGAQNVWMNITDLQAGLLNNVVFNGNETLTVLRGGTYRVDYSMSFFNSPNIEYLTAVLINGEVQNNTVADRKLGAGGDTGNVGGTGLLKLEINDTVRLAVLNKDSGVDLSYTQININLIEIAPTTLVATFWEIATILAIFFTIGATSYNFTLLGKPKDENRVIGEENE